MRDAGSRREDLPRLDADDAVGFDEPTRVGTITREIVAELMRRAELDEEARRPSVPPPSTSGFRLVDRSGRDVRCDVDADHEAASLFERDTRRDLEAALPLAAYDSEPIAAGVEAPSFEPLADIVVAPAHPWSGPELAQPRPRQASVDLGEPLVPAGLVPSRWHLAGLVAALLGTLGAGAVALTGALNGWFDAL